LSSPRAFHNKRRRHNLDLDEKRLDTNTARRRIYLQGGHNLDFDEKRLDTRVTRSRTPRTTDSHNLDLDEKRLDTFRRCTTGRRWLSHNLDLDEKRLDTGYRSMSPPMKELVTTWTSMKRGLILLDSI